MGHSGRGRGRGRAGAVDSPPTPSAARFASARTAPSGGDVEPAFRFREAVRGSRRTQTIAPEDFSVLFLFNGLQGGKFPCHRIRRRFGGVGEPPLREDGGRGGATTFLSRSSA